MLQPDAEKIRTFAPKIEAARTGVAKLTRGDEAVTHAVRREYGPLQVIFTTGRTALPTQFVYAGGDMDRLFRIGRRLQDVAASAKSGRSLNVFPFAPHLAFWQMYAVGVAGGSLMLHTGGGKVLGTRAISRRSDPDAAEGADRRARLRLSYVAPGETDGVKLEKLEMHRAGRRAGAGSAARASRRDVRADGTPNVRVHSIYGFTEARNRWGECPPPDY